VKATSIEFRFRVFWIALLLMLGFWSPWVQYLQWGARGTAWLWLGFEVTGLGLSARRALQVATGMLIAFAGVAFVLRAWGTAYLGTWTVNHSEMKAGKVLADGPYRYVRNPLYLGSWMMFVAIAALMPVSGAAVSLVLLAIFLLRLILAEESFLLAALGDSYVAYRQAVPRVLPALRPRVTAGGRIPQWGRAVVGEILPLGVLVSFAVLSWRYNSQLLVQGVVISFGLSLIAKATLKSAP
jgi:protein-S-isoprenylcysteine O-methyltransferase Ste14